MLFKRNEITLFQLGRDYTDFFQLESHEWVVLDRRSGKLSVKTTRQTLDCNACRLHRNIAPAYRDISYAELPALIEQSIDPGAQKYIGMTRENYQTYLTE